VLLKYRPLERPMNKDIMRLVRVSSRPQNCKEAPLYGGLFLALKVSCVVCPGRLGCVVNRVIILCCEDFG